MPTRILRDGILDSERVDQLSMGGELFYRRLMSVADDYGRFEADPVILRARCYPRRTNQVEPADIEGWIFEAVQAGLMVVYFAGRKRYLEILDFGQRLRIKKSKFPAPPESAAFRRHRPLESESESEAEAEAESEAEAEAEGAAVAAAGGGVEVETPPETPADEPPKPDAHVNGTKSAVNGHHAPGKRHDKGFVDFRITAEHAGMSGSEPDWDVAEEYWRQLALAERVKAHEGIRAREGTDDPALRSLPQNYIKAKKWQRHIRGPDSPGRRAPRSVEDELRNL